MNNPGLSYLIEFLESADSELKELDKPYADNHSTAIIGITFTKNYNTTPYSHIIKVHCSLDFFYNTMMDFVDNDLAYLTTKSFKVEGYPYATEKTIILKNHNIQFFAIE